MDLYDCLVNFEDKQGRGGRNVVCERLVGKIRIFCIAMGYGNSYKEEEQCSKDNKLIGRVYMLRSYFYQPMTILCLFSFF